MTEPNPFPEPARTAEQLYLIPPDDLPPFFEVEGKGVAITHDPQYGRRVTMVISGIVDKMAAKHDDTLGTIVKYGFKADRALVLDPGTIIEATNTKMLEQLGDFLDAEDFDANERQKPPAGVDPETGEKIDPDETGGDGPGGGV